MEPGFTGKEKENVSMDPKKTPPIENPDIGYMITNISYGIRQYFDAAFVDHDVTYPQSRVLTRLFSQLGKGDVNQRNLEYALGIKASSVSSLVRNLEQKGFITCERLPQDTRNKRILLTEKGLKLQNLLDRSRDRAEEEMTRGLTPEQVEVFRTCLKQVMENLEQNASQA